MTHCSVVMSVFNGQGYLVEAIQSVLKQSYSDFELVIIDDCSTDGSLQMIRSFTDSRIRLIQNDKNLGLAASLNKGVKESKGKYIARMDADDVMLEDRLQCQMNFLSNNPNIKLCGSFAIQIDENSLEHGLIKSPSGLHLEFAKWIPSPLIHPTVVVLRDLLLENPYDESLKAAQDYDLWLRLIMKGVGIYNLDVPLLKYRVHDKSITKSKLEKQSLNAYKSFVKHTNLNKITYKSFLSFCLQNYDYSLLQRFSDGLLVRKRLKLSLFGMWINQCRYFLFKYLIRKKNQVKL
ncbi:MAG: glycosyltransferase [Candidatus Cloacimonetes bacterium]|nr:glycosyltransferase [Candidatus Cloacimonadota bacterium]